MITHDLAVVSDMADQITVMRHGEVVESGATQHLLRHMQHPYSRMLFEASGHQVTLPEPAQPQTLLEVSQVVRDYRLPRKGLLDAPRHHRAVDGVSFSLNRGSGWVW